jgi:Ca2+-binding EF-hand superfamily protein
MISSISGSSYSLEDLKARQQSRFKTTDADGNGQITKSEMQASRSEDDKGPSVDDIFSQVDTNQDGVIDESEDEAAAERMPAGGPEKGQMDSTKMAEEIFKKADANSDGQLSEDELAAVAPKDNQGPSVEDLFAAADSDSNGSISVSDLASSLKQSFEEMRGSASSSTSTSYNYQGTGSTTLATQSTFSAVA